MHSTSLPLVHYSAGSKLVETGIISETAANRLINEDGVLLDCIVTLELLLPNRRVVVKTHPQVPGAVVCISSVSHAI